MEDTPLPQYNRKTTFRVKAVDMAANIGIKVGGIAVIAAVLGLIVFIFLQVWPLFQAGEVGQAREPVQQSADKPLLIHADEYRRVALRVDASGTFTIFALPNGETIRKFKPEALGDATITSAMLSLRARTTKKVGRIQDVPHYHLMLGTSDGRVLVGQVAYVTDFLRFTAEEEPANLAALHMPSEDEFKAEDYVPEVEIMDGKLIEHLNTFGFYRTIEPIIEIEREIDANFGDGPIKVVGGQINAAAASDDRNTVNLVVTHDLRVLLIKEETEVNDFTDEVEINADTTELTERVSFEPDFVLINERMQRLIMADEQGWVHVLEWDSLRRRFDTPYPPFNVFGPNADADQGMHWRNIVNEQRSNMGYDEIAEPLRLTVATYLLGDQTIIFGDNRGGVQAWFATPSEEESAPKRLARIRTHPPGKTAIKHIEPSPIHKAFLVIEKDGKARAIHNTAERTYAEFEVDGGTIGHMSIKGDGAIMISNDGAVHHWWIDAPHAEASLKTLFSQVWYEDFKEPEHVWQSSAGSDDVETKISLTPLVYGTVKAALYALLFSVPLAVLAAIYTSEFMHRNLRAIFKPAMEVMASLPSVVLGFLAALYFAPKAAPMWPTILTGLVVIPSVFMTFGWIWSRCPPSFVGKFGRWASTGLLFALLMLGIWLSALIGPRAEIFLFPAVEGADPAYIDPVTFEPISDEMAAELNTGDFRAWTDGGQELKRESEIRGTILPRGWWIPGGHNVLLVILAIPLALIAGWGFRKLKRLIPRDKNENTPIDRVRHKLEGSYKGGLRAVGVDAAFSLGFAAVLAGVGFLLSLAFTPLVELIFFTYDHPTAERVGDFRRWMTGPEGWKFEQANSMIVGFAMGFAVVPIIYTIAEDALTSVPNQLRAASLACGASRWQTTMRVVMPAAVSGIFSGIVIGLGRALGETMIVLMALGGTPVMEWQPLSGGRPLSAAIATEMPEAPHGGTLYRTLFLAGFLLLCMTFVINTLAEAVRIRLRKKLSRL